MNHCLLVMVASVMALPQDVPEDPGEGQVETEQIETEDDRRHDDHDRGCLDLLAARPGDLLELAADLAEEGLALAQLARSPGEPIRHRTLFTAGLAVVRHLPRLSDRHRSPTLSSAQGGRPGGTRTPNPRFWRP